MATPPRRPPETPPPDPAEQAALSQLARQASETAKHLRDCIEAMDRMSWQPDGYDKHKLGHVADSLAGMALRCAMSANDIPLLNDLTGRAWTSIPPLT